MVPVDDSGECCRVESRRERAGPLPAREGGDYGATLVQCLMVVPRWDVSGLAV
jgi:hypothetical protein